jgi:hypothetical protein
MSWEHWLFTFNDGRMKNYFIISLLFIQIFFLAGCTKVLIEPSDSDFVLEDFEMAWNAVNDVYPCLEFKDIDWDRIYLIYRERAMHAKGDDTYQIIFDLLRELKDPHVGLINPGGGMIMPYPGPRWLKDLEAYDQLLVWKYFDKPLEFACQDKVEYGILDGNIGYIHFSNFNDPDAMSGFGGVLDRMNSTRGLILDIRRNTGGWTTNLRDVISKFISDSLSFMKGYTKGDIEYILPAVQPDKSVVPYPNPIVILMNGATISAGELFAEIMNQLPNVTLVGDTTDGAGCNDAAEGIEGDYILPSGIRVHVGTTYAMRYDGVPLELNGVLPEILLSQTREDLESGHDKQLEFAMELLHEL